MKIIKKALNREEMTFEHRCETCGTKFEFQGKEANLCDNKYNYIIIECPVCKTENKHMCGLWYKKL
jgi:DNA-directed RNA polymerase subunit RPC12/RpoP